MNKETYVELEEIIVKDAKNDYLIFEVFSFLIGVMLVLAMVSAFPNAALLIVTSTGILAFIISYPQADKAMQDKLAKKKAMMDEIKKDVK